MIQSSKLAPKFERLEEEGKTYRWKRFEHKDEHNNPKTLNNKNSKQFGIRS